MEKKLSPVSAASSSASSAASSSASSASPSWRALLAAEQKKAKEAKAAKSAKAEKAAKEAKEAKEIKEIKQGQVRKARQDALTIKHNASVFRKAAAQERAEKELTNFKAELAEALSLANELTRALAQVPAEARYIRPFPYPGIVLAWTLADASSASSALSAPSKPSKPSASASAPSKKALARKEKADARARLGLGKAKSVPRVRTASDAPALAAASSAALSAASSAASALRSEEDPGKRQELHRTYTKASVWAKDLYFQATVAELIGVVDGLSPSELSVVPFAAKAKTAQRRRLLWVGRQIGRGLAAKRAEAKTRKAKAVAKAEIAAAPSAPEELDEFGAWYLENQSRAKQGLAPLAPLAPEITVGEAEDLDQRASMSFDELVAALEADVKKESYIRDMGLRCGPMFLEGELHDAVAAYSENLISWNEALEAVLAKCYAPIQQGEAGGSNE